MNGGAVIDDKSPETEAILQIAPQLFDTSAISVKVVPYDFKNDVQLER